MSGKILEMNYVVLTFLLVAATVAAQSNAIVRKDCRLGDIGMAFIDNRYPNGLIIWNPCRAAQLGAVSRFYWIHEHGHITLRSSDERKVDCWAAQQLREDRNTLSAAVKHFRQRGNEYHPRYGTMTERAQRIIDCSGVSNLADVELDIDLSKKEKITKQKGEKKRYIERKLKSVEYVMKKYHAVPFEMKQVISAMKQDNPKFRVIESDKKFFDNKQKPTSLA
jgi:hypothetical protein